MAQYPMRQFHTLSTQSAASWTEDDTVAWMPKSDPGANRAGSFMEVEPGAPHLRESVMMKDEPDTAEFNPKKPFFLTSL